MRTNKAIFQDDAYNILSPEAEFCPWVLDQDFQRIYQQIRLHTLVDRYRLYELWTLAESALAVPGNVLEVGAWRGGSAALLAARIASRRWMYIADTFQGVVKAGTYDNRYKGGEHADTSERTVRELLHQLELKQWKIFSGIFPDETGELLQEEKFCLCHIDVDVYTSSEEITRWIWPRLNVGGVLVYDDYGFFSCQGVRRFVDEFFPPERKDSLRLYNLNGHAVVVKRHDE